MMSLPVWLPGPMCFLRVFVPCPMFFSGSFCEGGFCPEGVSVKGVSVWGLCEWGSL